MGKEVFMNMDKQNKQKFTAALVRCAEETSGPMFEAGFIGFYVEDTYINSAAAVLPMNGTYFYCPLVPNNPAVYRSYGVSNYEIERYWTDFWKHVRDEYSKNERYRHHFTGKDKTFNYNGGKTAFVLNGKVYVCWAENIDNDTLIKLGFTKDMSLFVPFSNGEAYYEPSADHHCNNCGLLSMC